MRDRWQVAITFRAKVLGTVLAVLGCLAALLCSSIARAGSVSLPGYHIIFIDGDIDASTLTEFRVLVAQIDGWGMVRLNSPGGDLESAISIGRIVRAQSLGTDVAHQDSCASACIFILAAGVDRSAYGKIGIHRPHTLPVFRRKTRGKSTNNLRLWHAATFTKWVSPMDYLPA